MGWFARWQPRVTAARLRVWQSCRKVPVAPSTWYVAALTLLIGCLPVFSRPSYETALLFGLLLPPLTAVSSAFRIPVSPHVEPLLLAAIRRAAAHALVLTAVLSLHAARVGWCSPEHDLAQLTLGPVLGIFVAAFWGTYAGLCATYAERHRRLNWLRVALALAGPWLGIGAGVVHFYASPTVFAFDSFVGFFAGSPYDTGFDPTQRLISYRLGTLGGLLFLWALARHLELTDRGRPRFVRFTAAEAPGRWRLGPALDRAVIGLGVAGLGLFLAIAAFGEQLGHRSSEAWIRQSLGQTMIQGRCEVVFGPTQKHEAVRRLALDCDAWLQRLERRLGVAPLERVTAFVFDGPAQKELLMGAANTQIAKPWRREIYLNGALYPDDVVGHELAHVVGGQVAQGPFRVAGSLGGWLPNPGLIEGLAVALAPDEDGELTALEWSAALQSIDKLPPLAELFSLGFLQHSGPLAYTVAGAFVEWLGQSFGKRAVREWYAGKSLVHATGRSMAELEHAFAERLHSLDLPEAARQAALAKFARPGVYSRRCPHAVDRALAEGDQRLAAGDAEAACNWYGTARRLDATEVRARFGLGECAKRDVSAPDHQLRAEQAFRSIAEDASQPLPVRQRAEEQLGDLLLGAGDAERARPIYDAVAERTFDVDRRRSLEIKRAAQTTTEVQAVRTLLLGLNGESAWDLAVRDLLRWSEAAPEDGTPDYLLGRNFWQKGREAAAVEHLDRALARNFRLPELRAEAWRQRTIVACALGDRMLATALAERLSHEPALPNCRRLGIQRVAERCAGRLVGDDWPETASGALTPTPPLSLAPPSTEVAQPPPHASATDLAYDSERFECPAGMEKVPGATFWVGSKLGTKSPDEAPRFQTKVRGFCMDRTEVTVAAYGRCVSEGHCRPALGETASCNARHADRLEFPINCVDYAQAVAHCASRQARLPTEIEWEYAARGGPKALKYPWGDASPDGRACWKSPSSCRVKSFAAGAFGLYDMTGNVWEWTASDYGAYPWSVPLSSDGLQKIYRGGGWSRRFEKWMHVGLRNRSLPAGKGAHLGFRCVQSPPQLSCPFGTDHSGACLLGVLGAECPTGEAWNGQRCAKPGEPDCPAGTHVEAGQGCVRDVPLVIHHHALDLQGVRRQRSAEFDADCRHNQPKRPNAFRYLGSSHEARNQASSRAGCKNRDVGVGWNSTCCP